MLIVMRHDATEQQLQDVLQRVQRMGLTAHPMPGPTRTAIGVTGNTSAINADGLSVLPGVRDILRVTKAYKLASREMKADDTLVEMPHARVGGGGFTVLAGPCSVENESMMVETAQFLSELGVRVLRGGAYKPRTSPYAFQGLEIEGLDILEAVRRRFSMDVVTEIVDADHLPAMIDRVDMLQVGARNMQNFALLKRLSEVRKPVLLKRGASATLEEWLMAAEYLLAGGNRDVVVCERGIRTYNTHTRNTLDLSAVPSIKNTSHLPVIVDPSHGTGVRDYVPAMARAALAAGADGIMVEVHPCPAEALSDGPQSLDFAQFERMYRELAGLAAALKRPLC